MDSFNLALTMLDGVSAVICFVLVWFMTKPYRYTGETQFIGLPFAFTFLGLSYVLGVTRYFEAAFNSVFGWVQLFTQSYAFAFLAVTYYFSRQRRGSNRFWLDGAFAAIISAAVISYAFFFVAPNSDLPSFSFVDDWMRVFNILCLTYISIHTLRGYVSKPDPKTIWIPFSFLLLDFSQYSFLIWSLDASFSAFVGAHFLRLAGLLVFLIVIIQTFYASNKAFHGKESE